jgi:hypothetical protein
VEAYNAFNHTQWSALNVAATFNSAGKIANLPTALGGAGGRFGFGAPSTARSPRNIQLAMKVYF